MTCSLHDTMRLEQTCSFRSQVLADWLVLQAPDPIPTAPGLNETATKDNSDDWLFRSPKSPRTRGWSWLGRGRLRFRKPGTPAMGRTGLPQHAIAITPRGEHVASVHKLRLLMESASTEMPAAFAAMLDAGLLSRVTAKHELEEERSVRPDPR
jgi:hypothetical protein